MSATRKIVRLNENHRRIGEDHPRAKLSDRDCELIRQLAAEGMPYRLIARKFDIHRRTVIKIVQYERRGHHARYLRRCP